MFDSQKLRQLLEENEALDSGSKTPLPSEEIMVLICDMAGANASLHTALKESQKARSKSWCVLQ